MYTYISKVLIIFCATFFLSNKGKSQEIELPFTVKDSLYKMDLPETLGLSFALKAKTVTIFKPDDNENKYNHGVVLFPFKGCLYAQWQSSSVDEDAPDTQVMYSRSKDGITWSEPLPLTDVWNKGIKTSGGWWSDGDTLVAYICVWPNYADKPKGGYTEYCISTDGIHWSGAKSVLSDTGDPVKGVIEQDPHVLPEGPLITAFHMQPGLVVTPFFTYDPLGIKGWTQGQMQNLPSNKTISREIEPGWFYREDGAVVMVFRDQNSTFKKLASVSTDKGKTWTTPTLINTPDSRAKQSAGNLPDGTAFMVNNPSGCKKRFPLVITLSRDGKVFDKAFLIRSGGVDMQKLRYEGRYKRIGYSYPKSVIWGEFLFVSYATNKEDVELTRIPISSLVYEFCK